MKLDKNYALIKGLNTETERRIKRKEIFVLKFIIIKGFLLIKIRGQINL